MFASFPISIVTFSAYEGYIRDVLRFRKDELFIKECKICLSYRIENFFRVRSRCVFWTSLKLNC
jgi:hypothetical protein